MNNEGSRKMSRREEGLKKRREEQLVNVLQMKSQKEIRENRARKRHQKSLGSKKN